MGCPVGLTGGFISPYYDILIAVSMFIGAYVAVKYAAGKFFTNTGWEASALIELSDLWKSLLAAILAVGFFEFSRWLSCTWAGNADPTVVAMMFLQKILLKGILEGINDVFTIQMAYSILNTFSFRPHEAVWTWTFKIAPGADSIVGVMNILGYGLAALFGSVSAQLLILSILNATMYQYFLPAGILLRFLPPTREAGNFLICMAVAFQVVFPMTYVINEKILNDIWVLTGRGSEYEPYISSNAIGFWKYLFVGSAIPVGAIANVGKEIIEVTGTIAQKIPIIGLGATTAKFLTAASMEIMAYNLTMGMLKPILEALAELSLVSLFLPAFSMTITFAFINATTKFAQTKV